jgi:hypothetical protein
MTFPEVSADLIDLIRGDKVLIYFTIAKKNDGFYNRGSTAEVAGTFLYITPSRQVLGHIHTYTKRVHVTISPGAKRQKPEADLPAPSITKANNSWIYADTPPFIFICRGTLGIG